jgi:hypothetical protein
MKLSRITQLYNRRDRLQEMIDAQTDQIMELAKKQIEIEKDAYVEVFGPIPEADPKNHYGDRWKWFDKRRRDATHLGDWYLKIDKWEPLHIECWGRGCRGGEDWRETGFKIDERIAEPDGQEAMRRDYVVKYQALKEKQHREAKASLEAKRRSLEEELRKLGDQS